MQPRFMPMLCPPIPWENHDKGGHILWRSSVIRTRMAKQMEEVRALYRQGRVSPGSAMWDLCAGAGADFRHSCHVVCLLLVLANLWPG